MNKLISYLCLAGLLGTVLPVQTHAQWYTRYGAMSMDSLTEDQCLNALRYAKNGILLGGVTAIVGLSAVVPGIYFYKRARSNNAPDGTWDSFDDAIMGLTFLTGGALLYVIGLRFGQKSADDKRQIEEILGKFPLKVSLNPYLSKSLNHYSTGLSLTITF